MKVSEVKEILSANIYACDELIDEVEVDSACGSDLMSDVLAFAKHQGVLLTGLNNTQVIRTSEMMDIAVVVFVRGKVPDKEVVELAKMRDIIILMTDYPLYTACGLLYEKGLGKE